MVGTWFAAGFWTVRGRILAGSRMDEQPLSRRIPKGGDTRVPPSLPPVIPKAALKGVSSSLVRLVARWAPRSFQGRLKHFPRWFQVVLKGIRGGFWWGSRGGSGADSAELR